MLSFAPPVKVARTQRLGGAAEASPDGPPPTSLADSVVQCGTSLIAPAEFLSGVGRHMVWLVDEDRRVLRLWNVSGAGWRRTQPRIAPIPHFAAADEGLPLFVSEMGDAEESLAFCSERGAVSSLDHSVELQLLDGDAAVSVSCFTCVRRLDCGDVVLTAMGTTQGCLVVDVKENGEHMTLRYDRAAGVGQSSRGHTGGSSRPGTPGAAAARRSTLWRAVRSLLSGRGGDDGNEEAAPMGAAGYRMADPSPSGGGRAVVRGGDDGDSVSRYEVSSLAREADGADALAFTHALFRGNYPREVVAVNAASELMILEAAQQTLSPRWVTNVQSALGRAGYVITVTETRHRVCVLFHAVPTATDTLPALVLATFSSSQGSLIHCVQVNTIAGLVRAASEAPRHHVRLHIHDSHAHAVLLVRHYCVRVNLQVGVRSPCLSVDTGLLEGLPGPLTSLLRVDGSAVTLSAEGPVNTWERLWEHHPPAKLTREPARETAFVGGGADGSGSFSESAGESDAEAERCVTELLRAVEADGGRLTLDAAVLHTSDEMARQRHVHRGNWRRADLDADDANIVLYVTRDLRRRQQRHRRFLLALLRRPQVRGQLQPETVAQLISTQEALLSQLALRGLQNVGVLDQAAAVASVPQPALLDVGGGGGGGHGPSARPMLHLLESTAQVERCQQLLRGAILRLSARLRRTDAADGDGGAETREGAAGPDGAAASVAGLQRATAVELVFASPAHAVALIREVGESLLHRVRGVTLDSEEKLAVAHAAASIFVIVAQTITESREASKGMYAMPESVRGRLWTASRDAAAGLRLAFHHMCVTLADALADSVEAPVLQRRTREAAGEDAPGSGSGSGSGSSGGAGGGAFAGRAASLGVQGDLLELIAYLLLFSLSHATPADERGGGGGGGGGDNTHASAALRQTLLRAPFTVEPFGYPFGAPRAPAYCAALGTRALQLAESLAMHFDAADALLAFALAVAEVDPQPHAYAKLRACCERNPRVLSFALEALWRQRREWELLSLPVLLAGLPSVAYTRDEFLEQRAPHLLWLAAPDRFDALTMESAVTPPHIPYGPTQLEHRSRCLSLGKLAWIAGGAHAGARHDALALEAALVGCQRSFLSPQCDDGVLGLQDLVQRLLELDGEDAVPAWVGAATVAAMAATDLSEDLLAQVARRCRQHDGDALRRLREESVSELETIRMIAETSLGKVVTACAPLQDRVTLQRVCQTVLPDDEVHLMLSWLEALWSGER